MGVVKERLLNTHYMYYCLNCGKFLGNLMVRDSKGVQCPCGSKLITFLKKNYEDTKKALKKKLSNQPLNKEEEKEFKRLEQKAGMFLNYGYMAPYALAGRGVGTRNGLRILKGFYQTEEDFLKKIIKAEKNFVKTSKFWMKKK